MLRVYWTSLDADTITDRIVSELPEVLRPGDVMISNDTRVIPGRLRGKRGDASIEVTLHKQEGCAIGALSPNRPRSSSRAICSSSPMISKLKLSIRARQAKWACALMWKARADRRAGEIRHHAASTLYQARKTGDQRDKDDYQTIFAKRDGAVAAPTAGLHFTDRLLKALDERGVIRKTLTLHVGAGTFLPVTAQNTDDHKMHAEWGEITPEVADELNRGPSDGGRLLCIGTTSMRLIESAAQDDGTILPFQGETDIFITPGYRFKAADMLMTNFHLPKSTLVYADQRLFRSGAYASGLCPCYCREISVLFLWRCLPVGAIGVTRQ